ncbi:TonB-dependent receptor [Ideonella sp.]|uniref:TonB-dependent receptor n=1 Tax=Ideonella sp. TaxID=1929293 RepID=UPI002B4858A6|nr:TonB-dependent receptor [Ideonella sp.]HJV70815.1 TonB-dependent receptor [Ideonella sp.]
MHHHFAVRPLAAAIALAGLTPAASWAQTSPPAESDAGKLQTITVTAERRNENILDVPSSISTISPEMLDVLATSGQDIRVLSGRAPSLNIESSYGRAFPRFYIRGYGNTDFRLNASQPVSLVYDDVVQENPILKGFPVFDLDRVEVLRGPQGTLFGRNTPAGVVKFESARPTRKFEGYGSISAGSFSTVNAEGAVNVPTSEDSALRISLLSQNRGDWVENTYDAGPTQKLEGYSDNAVRLQWLLQPGKDFSALFNLHGRDFDGSARLFRANIIKPGTNDLVDGFDPKKIANDGVNHSELQNYGASARLRWDLPGVALHSITGFEQVHAFSRGDIDGGAPPYVFGGGPGSIPFLSETADGMPEHRQVTQEFRIESTGAGPLGWQAGVYLFHEDYRIESFGYDSTAAGNPEDQYERVHQKNNAYAAFGALNYAVTPELKLRGGLRYTRDRKTFAVEDYYSNEFVPAVLNGKPDMAGLAAHGPLSAATSDNKLNGDLSGTYTLTPSVNLYARAATGFRASSVQGAGPFNDQSIAKPESNTSYEAGVKAELFDRRARLSFGVFSYTVKDLQLTAVGGASGNANVLLNAKKATGRGFELDLQAYLTERLMTSLGVGYNDTEIKDPNLAVSVCGNSQNLTTPNCTVTDPVNANGQALINGNPLPQAPKTTVNFTLKYTQPVGSGDFYVLTDWTYRSRINFFLYESVEFTGKSLTEGGLRLGYVWGDGKYEAALFGRNITNQIRVVGGIDFDNLTGFINEPRTWGASFRATF